MAVARGRFVLLVDECSPARVEYPILWLALAFQTQEARKKAFCKGLPTGWPLWKGLSQRSLVHCQILHLLNYKYATGNPATWCEKREGLSESELDGLDDRRRGREGTAAVSAWSDGTKNNTAHAVLFGFQVSCNVIVKEALPWCLRHCRCEPSHAGHIIVHGKMCSICLYQL